MIIRNIKIIQLFDDKYVNFIKNFWIRYDTFHKIKNIDIGR